MEPQPFLQWRWCDNVNTVLTLPKKFQNYHEVFLGGAELFFKLSSQPSNPERKYFLSDSDPEIGRVYSSLQLQTEELIKELERLFVERQAYSSAEDHFYMVRNLDRKKEFDKLSTVEKAARTIYLNQTSLGNAYRKNSRGYFSPSFGKRNKPYLDVENLKACANALQLANLKVGKFGIVEQTAEKGDLVFFSPPPIPFIDVSHYTGKHEFSFTDHEELRDLCDLLTERGVYIIMRNSSAIEVFDLYQDYRIQAVRAEDNLVTQLIISNANLLSQ